MTCCRASNRLASLLGVPQRPLDAAQEVLAGRQVALTVSSDTSKTKQAITNFMQGYNDLMSAIDTQVQFDPSTGQAGPAQEDGNGWRRRRYNAARMAEQQLTRLQRIILDIDRLNLPLRGFSTQRGTTDESTTTKVTESDTSPFLIQVSGYNGASSVQMGAARVTGPNAKMQVVGGGVHFTEKDAHNDIVVSAATPGWTPKRSS